MHNFFPAEHIRLRFWQAAYFSADFRPTEIQQLIWISGYGWGVYPGYKPEVKVICTDRSAWLQAGVNHLLWKCIRDGVV